MASFRFLPIGNGAEYLKAIDFPVENHTVSQEENGLRNFILGRNTRTGTEALGTAPNSQYVSRAHVKVIVRDDNHVFLQPVAREKDIVFLNGSVLPCTEETEIHIGDSISLLGRLDYFNFILVEGGSPPIQQTQTDTQTQPENEPQIILYSPPSKKARVEVVELLDSSPSVCEVKASPPPVASKEIISCATTDSDDDVVFIVDEKPISLPAANEVMVTGLATHTTISTTTVQTANTSHRVSDLVKALLMQYECNICIETMACAVSLNSCGHCFCYNCIADWAQKAPEKAPRCPICSATFDLKLCVPNRVVDNTVRELLKSEQEALSAWETRVAQGLERQKQTLAAPATTPPAPYLPLPHPMNFINQRPSAAVPTIPNRQNSRGYGNPAIVDLTGGSDNRVRPHNNHHHYH
eukprot:gene10105-11185_t